LDLSGSGQAVVTSVLNLRVQKNAVNFLNTEGSTVSSVVNVDFVNANWL